MNNFLTLTQCLLDAMEVPGLKLPVAGVKLYRHADTVPDAVMESQPDRYSVTACHALRAAMLDDAVYLTKETIGCIAAAISVGLVEKTMPQPLEGKRIYTEIMRESCGNPQEFAPPSPRDFSDGSVYACREAGRKEFSLFGEKDSGRYKTRAIAVEAIAKMPAIQPPIMQGIFYFSPTYNDIDLVPDVVVLALRPVELCRVVQGYQFLTGERVRADIGGLRAGCSDLIVQPYLFREINFSPFCLGARLIARFEGDRMGLAMPFSMYATLVQGVEESRSGFPFAQYPGARPQETRQG